MLWSILCEKVWDPMKPQYRVLIGMVIFAIIGPNLPLNFKPTNPSTMFAFTAVPAGWYVINRLIYWLIPGFSGFFIIRLDVLLLFRLLWLLFVFPIKFLCSMLIGPIAVLFVLCLLIRDVVTKVKKRKLSERVLKDLQDLEKPRVYRVK